MREEMTRPPCDMQKACIEAWTAEGYSDARIADILKLTRSQVAHARRSAGLHKAQSGCRKPAVIIHTLRPKHVQGEVGGGSVVVEQ